MLPQLQLSALGFVTTNLQLPEPWFVVEYRPCQTYVADMKTRTLEALVASKVSTGGSIELIDVIELLKLGQVPVDGVSRRLSGENLARFQDLVQIAELEGQGRQKEGRPILLRLLARRAR